MIETVRTHLADVAFAATWAKGESMTLEDVMDYVMSPDYIQG